MTPPSERRRVSAPRLLAALVLVAWAGLFWFLIASGRTSLYLSARTGWVVPVGAVILSVAASGRLLTVRAMSPSPLGSKEAWGLGLLVLPVAAILVLPPTTLGSYAASRRSGWIGTGISSSPRDLSTGELNLIDLAGATRSPEGMRALSARAGDRVSLVGFVVMEKGAPADEFLLTRFIVSCCAADALSVQIRIVGAPPGKFHEDDWVRVGGTMYPLGTQIVVQADQVTGVERPEQPYLSP
jgi:uncharacterized repeat protein (TIGR03943 family)